MVELSKTAVRKAGSAVRQLNRKEIDDDSFKQHLQVIQSYRDSFNEPLKRFRLSLIDLQKGAGIEAETSSRLKRTPTILDKLLREPKLDLSRMQDIGGCRSVVSDIDSLYQLKNLITATWQCRVRDYIKLPRLSGYRSLHLIANVDDVLIELQVRTHAMHKWAETVEAISGIIGKNFKQDGEELIQIYMKAVSESMHAKELGLEVAPAIDDKITELHSQVVNFLHTNKPSVKKRRHNVTD